MPRARVVIAFPLYFSDIILGLLLIWSIQRQTPLNVEFMPIRKIAAVYLICVCMSEFRGMFEYGIFAESLYMITRFVLAISLAFILPKLIATRDDLKIFLKASVVGLLVSSALVILYSLPATRPIIVGKVFSLDFLNPGADRLVFKALSLDNDLATRGKSLVGAATMTAGFLGSAWAIAIWASRWNSLERYWRLAATVASVVTPVAILMTYGRTAWLIVLVIGTMISFFGFSGGRRNLILFATVCFVLIHQYGVYSDQLMVERVVKSTHVAMESPTKDVSARERFMSFVDPFTHLAENPSWILLGAGRAGERATRRNILEEQLFDEGKLATHSGFSLAYFSFGFPAAVCQVLILFFVFRLILYRLKSNLCTSS